MEPTASTRQYLLWPRRIGLAGAILTLIGAAVYVFFNPFADPPDGPHVERIGTALALFALVALVGILVSWWRPLLSALVLLVAWVGSLVQGYSWLFFFAPPPLTLIGLGNLLCFVAALLMTLVALSGRRRDEAN